MSSAPFLVLSPPSIHPHTHTHTHTHTRARARTPQGLQWFVYSQATQAMTITKKLQKNYNLAIINRLTSNEINVPLLHLVLCRLLAIWAGFFPNRQLINDKGQQMKQRYVYFLVNILGCLWFTRERIKQCTTQIWWALRWSHKLHPA